MVSDHNMGGAESCLTTITPVNIKIHTEIPNVITVMIDMYLTGAKCIQTRGVVMKAALQLHLSKLFNRYSTWLLKGQISSCLPDCHTHTHTC